ncbi:hypothetical protein, partial [Pantoea dispersa]|uniref:hypothetical protein n=1 Tax=Pantoea dispersa TaxID=59814 RepID=UPI001C8BF172
KACALPENPAGYRHARPESDLFNKAVPCLATSFMPAWQSKIKPALSQRDSGMARHILRRRSQIIPVTYS